MSSKSGRAWTMERASVSRAGKPRAKSNKYSKSDSSAKPAAGRRQKIWVGGYTRQDGTTVSGYYRDNSANQT